MVGVLAWEADCAHVGMVFIPWRVGLWGCRSWARKGNRLLFLGRLAWRRCPARELRTQQSVTHAKQWRPASSAPPLRSALRLQEMAYYGGGGDFLMGHTGSGGMTSSLSVGTS